MTTKANDNEPSGDNAEAKPGVNDFSRDVLLEEIRYRRVKRWKIFSWATTVLFAIVVGTAAISSRYQLYLGHRILLALAAFVLGLFSCALLYQNISMEESAKNQLRSGLKEMEEVFPLRRTLFWTYFGYIGTVLLIALAAGSAVLLVNPVGDIPPQKPIVVTGTSWYFAVSGDSRDCGDLIMPKIARAIADNREQAPAKFYWHLGDFRAIYRIDCDIGKKRYQSFDCPAAPKDPRTSSYVNDAWDDFLNNQVRPFETTNTQVFLGIGNHELIPPLNRDKFKQKFNVWLTQDFIKAQRIADRAEHIPSEDGDTYYHFVISGVDFIYLDNADRSPAFSAQEINWLSRVLEADKKDSSIKTIIVGMHAALPYSKSSDHGMDASCQGICSGLQAYDLLYRAQNLGSPIEMQKHVYVLASHSHYFEENVFDTPEQRARGQVLPGWIVGTAGAEQYREQIRYGYLQVEVRPDGTINPQFKEVTREMQPLAPEPGAAELTAFCFEENKRPNRVSDAHNGDCACGEAKAQSPIPAVPNLDGR